MNASPWLLYDIVSFLSIIPPDLCLSEHSQSSDVRVNVHFTGTCDTVPSFLLFLMVMFTFYPFRNKKNLKCLFHCFKNLLYVLGHFACMEVWVSQECSVHGVQRRVPELLELKFQSLEICCVGAENWVRILCKSSRALNHWFTSSVPRNVTFLDSWTICSAMNTNRQTLNEGVSHSCPQWNFLTHDSMLYTGGSINNRNNQIKITHQSTTKWKYWSDYWIYLNVVCYCGQREKERYIKM